MKKAVESEAVAVDGRFPHRAGRRLIGHSDCSEQACTQINVSKLGTVPAATNAQSAIMAGNAGSAQTEATATFATNAANAATATNAGMLGGFLPAAYQGALPWALFNSDGTILTQSGGISLIAGPTAGYWVGFPEHLKAVMVTAAYTLGHFQGRGTPIAEVCGGATGLENCFNGPNDTTEAYVRTYAADNATQAPWPFMIVGIP